MSKIDTGGQAFASEVIENHTTSPGMTLLDYFADGYVPSELEIRQEQIEEHNKAIACDTYIQCSKREIRARIRYKEGMAMIAVKRRLEAQ